MSAPVSREALRARNELDVADFIERAEEERRSLYRDHLRCTVRYASPLLLDILRVEGVSAVGLVDVMEPPPGWPEATSTPPWGPSVRRVLPRVFKTHRLGQRSADQRLARCFGYGGAMLRPPSDPLGGFGVWTSADMMHAWIDLGQARLAIGGGEGHLSIPNLPKTIALGMPGRDIDRLVTHPLLDRRGYVVRRVREGLNGATILVFGCGVQPVDLTGTAACPDHDGR